MILSSTSGGWTIFDFTTTGDVVTIAGTLAMTPRFSRITTLRGFTLTRVGATTTGGGATTTEGVSTVSWTVTRRLPNSWASAGPAPIPKIPHPRNAANTTFFTVMNRMVFSLCLSGMGPAI
jgi:hypothetical protein